MANVTRVTVRINEPEENLGQNDAVDGHENRAMQSDQDEHMRTNGNRPGGDKKPHFPSLPPLGSGEDKPLLLKQLEDMKKDGIELSDLVTNPALRKWDSSEILNITIHQCARDGDAKQMEKILQNMNNLKRKINAHDENKLSALHYAARYNNFHTAKVLLDKGAEVNNKGDDDATPLHYAARYKRMRMKKSQSGDDLERNAGSGDELTPQSVNADQVSMAGDMNPEDSIFVLLIDYSADVNAKDIYNCTPLHYAAMRGNEFGAKELISFRGINNRRNEFGAKGGINIEAVDKQLMTALHLAATHNQTAIAKMLIDAGANLRCADDENSTPLHMASSEGNLDIVKLLFEAGEKKDGWVTISQMVTDQDTDNSTALHLAVENGHDEVTKILLEKNADVNTVTQGHATPLHLAAIGGELSIVKLLVERNARIDALNDTMATPLHKAAAYNHADVCQYLLEKGSRMDRRDKDGFTPLLLTAVYGHANSMKTLLRMRADINAVDKNDKTAIYMCAEENKYEALEVLLSHPKAKDLIDESDRYGDTPLHVAAMSGYVPIVKLLITKNADVEAKNESEQSPVHVASKYGRTNVVRELIKEEKTIVNDEDEDSNTALHLAALEGHTKVAQALLDAGADIEARNSILWTPLDCAASKGFVKVSRVLLEADAPVDAADRGKITPLHLASTRGHHEVVDLLLKWGADVSLQDADGNTSLDLAIDNNNVDVAEVIVKSSYWDKALKTSRIDFKTGWRSTPMRMLIKRMPDVAELVFNNCTTSNKFNPDHPDYEILFNYEFLDDIFALSSWNENQGTSDTMSSSGSVYDEDFHVKPQATSYTDNKTTLKRNHPLMIMVNSNREDLLAHPLVTSLLRHKWNRFGRYVYYFNLTLYSLFLAFLTGYLLVSVRPDQCFSLNSRIPDNCTLENAKLYPGNLSNNTNDRPPELQDRSTWDFILFIAIGKWVVLALGVVNIIREIIQMVQAKLAYFGWENLIEWILYISSLLLVIDFYDYNEVRSDWQWQLGAIAIFLGWIELVLFIRKFPRFGIYVVMFTEIFKTFLQFFIVFFLFLVSFALSFHVLLSHQAPFRSGSLTLLKTTIMMIGEFEYDTMIAGGLLYPEATYIVFIAFIVVMSILIMNLLVGLAVDDIKGVQEKSALKRLAMQVELALDVEGVLPGYFRRRFIVRLEKLKPNSNIGCMRKVFHVESSLSSAAIASALNPELNEIEKVQESQEKLEDQIANVRQRLKRMNAQNERIESMLNALLEHSEISWQEEDEHEETI